MIMSTVSSSPTPRAASLIPNGADEKVFPTDIHLKQSWAVLRIAFAAVPIIAGLDKYFDLLANWSVYVSPALLKILPIDAATLLHIVGIVEIVVGVAMLTRWLKISAYIAAV
jgi:uncharacterized membrane protein YphA (DoxX/SURF4 family)